MKLSSSGINGNELNWFTDYLFNRSQQCVQYNNTMSREEKTTCGVPQGSIIGPLLFTVFFNDFRLCLNHSRLVKFADDTVIYLAGKDTFIIKSRLSADMQAISNWCTDNELVLNLKKGKTEFMLFGTAKVLSMHKNPIKISYQFSTISVTTTYKYLGVILNPTLNMNTNFQQVMKKSNSRLRLLHKIRSHLNNKAAKSIYRNQ